MLIQREESQRKRLEEINNQKASHKIEELERAKQHLEQEVYVNKRRLEMETLATKHVSPRLSLRRCERAREVSRWESLPLPTLLSRICSCASPQPTDTLEGT